MPHRPKMIDGTAASRSTSAAAGRASRLGAYWVRNSATPIAIGTAMSIATVAMITVTQSRSAMPNRRVPPSTSQTREVRKFAWFWASDGTAWLTRNAPTSATIAMTSRPAPLAAPAKSRSPRRPVDAPSPARASRAAGVAVAQQVSRWRRYGHRSLSSSWSPSKSLPQKGSQPPLPCPCARERRRGVAPSVS